MGNLSSLQGQSKPPPARGYHASVVLNDRLFIWGGRANSIFFPYHSSLNVFSVRMPTGEWCQQNVTTSDRSLPCENACSASIGNTIYSYGGKAGENAVHVYAELYKLNSEDMSWTIVKTRGLKPEGRCGAAMCSMNRKLLLMGGYGPLPSKRKHPQAQYKSDSSMIDRVGWNDELFEFEPLTDCWSPVCVTGSKPSVRSDHTLTAVDGKRAILFGGLDGMKHLNDLWLFDGERKVWSHIKPSFPLWPQPRDSHTLSIIVCDNQEIKALLLGGHNDTEVLSDCWVLDVLRGIGEKVMFEGRVFGRCGHSTGCVTLSDGTVVVSVFGGYTKIGLFAKTPCFFQWNSSHPTLLRSGLESVVSRQFPAANPFPASGTSEEMRHLTEEVQRLTTVTEQQQSQLDQMNTQLIQDRADGSEEEKQQADIAVAESNTDLELELTLRRQITQQSATIAQLTEDIGQLNEDKQSLEQQMNRLSEETRMMENEKAELEQRINETEQLLRNAEAASEEAERRLRDSEQMLIIPAQDVQLSDKELGSGSFGGVRVGSWRGCLVAVKLLHEELAREHYQRRLFEQEVSVCSRLHHPNIASICGIISQRDTPLSLVMELLQASLADVIEAAHVSDTYLTLKEQTDMSRDCLMGLTYLHDLMAVKLIMTNWIQTLPDTKPLPRSVLHGDIRPTNILITSLMQAKLGDLGAARFTDASLSVGPLSPSYVAPERLADRTLPNSKEADVYSMGVSLGELFTGNQMDRQDRPLQLRSVRQRDLRLVCVKMACEDGSERMIASEALTVNDRVVKTEEYSRCGPRRMVKGVVDGVAQVTLCDKPW